MLFSFVCPTCKHKLEADASQSGVQAPCPQCGNLLAVPESRVEVGTTLAGFHLERVLGKGGMGEVYLARQLSVDRLVAVKVLPPGFAQDERAVARFLQEGKLAARLDHGHIATVHEAGSDSGTYYMAMAYVEGESLAERLKREGRLDERAALEIVRAVAEALDYAWDEFQLVHRDIKPANIMIDRRGRVFLMDLGLAKISGEDRGLTLSGAVVGTALYMSPEQAQGVPDCGVETDIYSLGTTLYHLVVGGAPFAGDTMLQILQHHIHTAPPAPSERNPSLSDGCCRLILKMMAKKPEGRHPTWRALLAEIDRLLEGKAAVDASVGSAPTSIPVQLPVSEPPPAPEAKARKKGRRLVWSLGAAAGVLVLAAVLLIPKLGKHPTAAAAGDAAGEPPSSPPAAAQPTLSAGSASLSPTVRAAVSSSSGPVLGAPWQVPELGMPLLPVSSGTFVRDGREIRLTRPFWLGKCEVTEGEYRVLAGGASRALRQGERYPVSAVAWQEAMSWCRRLTERERTARRLPNGYEYRLPTEAEWEYAYWAGGQGDLMDNLDEVAWHRGNSGSTLHPVGAKKANAWGFHDMGGNAWELCCEFFQWRYPQACPETDPVNLVPCANVPMRGFYCCTPPERKALQASFRSTQDYLRRGPGIGFRACLGPEIPVLHRLAEKPKWVGLAVPHTGDWGLEFDSPKSQVVIASPNWPVRGPLTVEAVFVWDGTGEAFVVGQMCPGGLWLEIRDGVLWARTGGTDGHAVGTPMLYASGQRMHAAAVRDAHGLRLYVNGEEAAGCDGEALSGSGSDAFVVGQAGETATHGRIEAVRVSRGPRYAAGFPLAEAVPLRADGTTLCLLDLEEGQGQVARDSSGNGNDARVEDAIWTPMWPCPVSEARLQQLRARLRGDNPGISEVKCRVEAVCGDLLSVDLSGNTGLTRLDALQGLPVAWLNLRHTAVEDLSPLRGLPLRFLRVSYTKVEDLSPLSGTPLGCLSFGSTQVRDLMPLAKCPLVFLSAWDVPLADLSPVADCPLRIVSVYSAKVDSLPEFTARTLQAARLDANPLSDLSPLAGQPLSVASVARTPVTDVTPLRGCPGLRWLGVPTSLNAATVAAQFPSGLSVCVDPTWDDIAYTEAYRAVRNEVVGALRRP